MDIKSLEEHGRELRLKQSIENNNRNMIIIFIVVILLFICYQLCMIRKDNSVSNKRIKKIEKAIYNFHNKTSVSPFVQY